MSDTVIFRITPEARGLLREHLDFFAPFSVAASQGDLPRLLGKDPEAQTEFRLLPNGDREVSWVYPLDDNADPGDGRLYLRDVFTFDPSESLLKNFSRECREASGADSPWLRSCRGLTASFAWDRRHPLVRDFAASAGRSYARPFAASDGSLEPELLAALLAQGDYLRAAGDLVRRRRPSFKIKVGDPQSYFQILPRGASLEVVLALAVDDDADPGNGRIFLKERFSVDAASGRMLGHERRWEVGPDSEPVGRTTRALLAALNRERPPDLEAAAAFLEALLPRLRPQARANPLELLSAFAAPSGALGKAGPGAREGTRGRAAAAGFAWEAMQAVAIEELARRAERSRGWGHAGAPLAEAEARARLEKLSDQVRAGLQRDSSRTPLEVLAGLPLRGEEAKLRAGLAADPLLRELDDLARETDAGLWAESALRLAEHGMLRDRGLVQAAHCLAQSLSQDARVGRRAAALLALTEGRAPLGKKFELLLPEFSRQVVKPSTLLGMTIAPFAGVAAEWGGLRLAAWGLGAEQTLRLGSGWRWAASLLGMGGEALAFTGVHRSFERWTQGPETAWRGLRGEVLSSVLLFGSLRLAAWGGHWALGRVGGEAADAAGRRFVALVQHGSGLAAMGLSAALSRRLGWAPDTGQGFGANLIDSSLAYLQASLGYRLADGLSGGHLSALHRLAREGVAASLRLAPQGAGKVGTLGAEFILRPEGIPSLRLFDLNQGGLQSDFRIPPGGEAFLDYLLFGHEGGKVRLFRDAAGAVFLEDRRPGVTQWRTSGREGFNFRDQPLLYNGSPLRPHSPVRLQEGDTLFFPIRRLKVSLPQHSELYAALAQLPLKRQSAIAALLRADPAPESWLPALEAGETGAEKSLARQLREVLAGRALLHGLPTELGIQGSVQAAMEKRLGHWAMEGWWDTSFQVHEKIRDPRWSPLEKSYHSLSAMEALRGKVASSRSLEELRLHLLDSPLAAIDEVPVPDWLSRFSSLFEGNWSGMRDLPAAVGLRQRVRDLAEERAFRDFEAYLRNDTAIPLPEREEWREEYLRLDGKRFEIFAKIRRGIPADDPDLLYRPEDLEERLYQVLERGMPLALLPRAGQLRGEAESYQKWVVRSATEMFPNEMAQPVDPWTGESVEDGGEEARYRLALHVLNRYGRRPVTGMPSPKEREQLHLLVKKHLDPQAPADFLGAQALLRRHFDQATEELRNMLLQGSPEEKAVLLHQYFGTFWRRDLEMSKAFRIALWLGQAGMYRETGVVLELHRGALRAVLSLGNMDQVSSERAEDFFLLHTHPELYQDAEGQLMGLAGAPAYAKTLMLAVGEPQRDGTHRLPSMTDLRFHLSKARDYLRRGFDRLYGKTPLYDPETRSFRNWVVHPFALSEMSVRMDERGQPFEIRVRIAAYPKSPATDFNYRTRWAELEALAAELGVPVKLEEVPYADLLRDLPWPLEPLR